MPHVHRFYVPPGSVVSEIAVLRDAEARHAVQVARVRPGEKVALFDGEGREWLGAVAEARKRELVVSAREARETPPPAYELTLVQAALGRDKAAGELIRRCVELGVTRFVFFRAERSGRVPILSEKWRRIAIESCKQCNRLWLPSFGVVRSIQDALHGTEGTLLLASQGEPSVPLGAIRWGRSVRILIGPEGDFTGEERQFALDQGARPISLGPRTFRSEVAAVLVSALALYHLGELGPRG